MNSGPGYQDPRRNYCFPDLFDRGEGFCTIQDPPGPFQIQIYCTVPEDPNAVVTLIGLDQNNNQIRSGITIQNGDGTVTSQWINGVQNVIYNAANAFQEPAQIFNKLTSIILPKRNGDLRLVANELNLSTLQPTGTTYLLGIYPYFLTNPSYRRYAFPAAAQVGVGYKPLPVETLVRRRAIPVHCPSDKLPINNIEALKYFMQAAWKDEEEQFDTANALRMQGKICLENEVRKNGSAIDRLNINFRGFGLFPRQPGSL